MTRKIWWNNNILDESEAKISLYSTYAMMGNCFEMTRSYNKIHFKLEEHIDRLFRSMKYLNLKIQYSKEQIINACNSISDINKDIDTEHRLLINVEHGLMGIYNGVIDVASGSNVIITDFPLHWTTQGMSKYYDVGINCIITKQKCIPSYIIDNKIKTHNRLHFLLANIEISNYKGDNNWALLTDENYNITETTGANFLIIKDGCVISPTTKNILDGISRNYIKYLCGCLNIDFIEKNIQEYDVINANGAFVTCTPAGILPVTSLNYKKIGDTLNNEIYQQLISLWKKKVNCDFEQQIKDWDNGDVDGNTPYRFK